MTVLSAFFTLVSSDLMSFTFLTTGHVKYFISLTCQYIV